MSKNDQLLMLSESEFDLLAELGDLDRELSRIADDLAGATDAAELEQLAAEQTIAADRLVTVLGLLRQVQNDMNAGALAR